MSITNAYITLSKNSPNLFWNNLFEDININIKQGGKASEIFVSNKGVLPLEVINCFIDADETGEVELYIEKAIEFCENKNQSINENIKEFGPAIINAILLLIVGLLMVAFLRDIMQKGLVDVMNRI
jgi:type II secretory pathway component PulF